jgi:hypothetical protein
MATRKTTKTSTTRKATTAKRSPRTAVKDAPKPAAFEKKVGDQKTLDAAVEAAASYREAGKKRDAAVKAAVKGGTSARQVGIATGLSHAAVLKIVKR